MNANPLRYRGYIYDTETGLYYLQSRYYDPVTGRFLNADDVMFLGATGTVLSTNIFAYCENDAVNMVDPGGHLYISYETLSRIFGVISDLSIALKIHTNKGLFGYIASYLGPVLSPYISIFFSWINSLPVVGQVIFVLIVSSSVWFATHILISYYIYHKGIDISLKWKWYGPKIDVVYR